MPIIKTFSTQLRAEPVGPLASAKSDHLDLSQLIYNERVKLIDKQNGWAEIEAIEQQRTNENGDWCPYRGFVRCCDLAEDLAIITPRPVAVIAAYAATLPPPASNSMNIPMTLPMGTRMRISKEGSPLQQVYLADGRANYLHTHLFHTPSNWRYQLVQRSRCFVGSPYLWGGRTPFLGKLMPHIRTGVDCSGLVNLLYRSIGVQIPRDAHDQRAFALSISAEALLPGDLVFLTTPGSSRVDHVLMATGASSGEGLLEARGGSVQCVVTTTFQQRFGRTRSQITNGYQSAVGELSFGRISNGN